MNVENKLERREWFKTALKGCDNLNYLLTFRSGIKEDTLPFKEKRNYVKKINHKIKVLCDYVEGGN